MKTLNDKLSSALTECNAKDELIEKHATKAQEATKGNSVLLLQSVCSL